MKAMPTATCKSFCEIFHKVLSSWWLDAESRIPNERWPSPAKSQQQVYFFEFGRT
jgi:hypothetical protein